MSTSSSTPPPPLVRVDVQCAARGVAFFDDGVSFESVPGSTAADRADKCAAELEVFRAKVNDALTGAVEAEAAAAKKD